MARTPRRFTGRTSGVSRRLARLMEGSVDTDRTYGDSIDPASDGRLEVKASKKGGLKVTPQGLAIDFTPGEKNLVKMIPIDDIATGATAADILATVNELLQAHRDTKRMRTI